MKKSSRELQNAFTSPGGPGECFLPVLEGMRAALTVVPPGVPGLHGRPWFPEGLRQLSPAYFEVLRWIGRCSAVAQPLPPTHRPDVPTCASTSTRVFSVGACLRMCACMCMCARVHVVVSVHADCMLLCA